MVFIYLKYMISLRIQNFYEQQYLGKYHVIITVNNRNALFSESLCLQTVRIYQKSFFLWKYFINLNVNVRYKRGTWQFYIELKGILNVVIHGKCVNWQIILEPSTVVRKCLLTQVNRRRFIRDRTDVLHRTRPRSKILGRRVECRERLFL